MSFTVQIKEEISKIESTESVRIAELSSYIRNNGNITKKQITLNTENEFILKRMNEFLEDLFNIKGKEDIINNLNFSKKNLYQLTIDENIDSLCTNLGIWDEKKNYLDVVPNYIIGSNEEIRAYIRGALLANG